MTYSRTARVEGVDVDTGTFTATLATEGEASDGHILSIKGGQVPERMPLLVSHFNDPSSQAGSIVSPKKHLKDAPPRLSVTGQIEMGGQGPAAEIRRDLVHMIDKGHVGSMSIRWDEVPGKTIRRVNLPSNHPYYVDPEKSSGPERWGSFFEEWRGLEGSIVALGADPGALIGRAEETSGSVSTFWRAMAEDAESRDAGKLSAALACVRIEAARARVSGASDAEVINAAADGSNEAFEPVALGERTVFLPASLAALLATRERIEVEPDLEDEPDSEEAPASQQEPASEEKPAAREPDPEPASVEPRPSLLRLDPADLRDPITVDAVLNVFSRSIDEHDKRIKQRVQDIINCRVGKVTQ